MVDAINSNSRAVTDATPPQPVALDAELAKYQRQLADWTHCDSAKTSSGKNKIAEINGRISHIKAKMQEAAKVRAMPPVAAAPKPLPLNSLGAYLDLHA